MGRYRLQHLDRQRSRPIRVEASRWLIAALALMMLSWPQAAAAQEAESLSGEDLLTNSADYDGIRIVVEGELVGDYGFRGDGFMWTQLNDDSYARQALVDGGPRTGGNIGIGIRMPTGLADQLDPVGGYRLEGPLVRAEGTWRHHDPDRGGESYLDVTTLTIVEPGRRLQEGPDWAVFIVGALLTSLAIGMWLRRRRDPDLATR